MPVWKQYFTVLASIADDFKAGTEEVFQLLYTVAHHAHANDQGLRPMLEDTVPAPGKLLSKT